MAYSPKNANGQATMANSEPVVLASDQSAVPVSGTITANLSATDNAVLDAIEADTTTIAAKDFATEATLASVESSTLDVSNATIADDAAFTVATSRVMMDGFLFDDVAPDSVNEGDAGAGRMSANRNQYVQIRDSAGNERGLNIAADGSLAVTVASIPSHAVTNAGTFAVQNTAATPAGTNNIGDVDVLTVNGVAPAFGTGVRGATVQRVTIATDDSVPVTNAGITTIAGAVSGTEMQVDVLTMPTVTVNAHAVTNAGTFVTQENGALLTAAQLIDDTVFSDDAAVTLGTSKGNISAGVAVQTDGTDPTAVSAEGDAAALRTDMNRILLVNQTHPRGTTVSADYASAQTNVSVIAAPGASLSIYITDIQLSNGATAGNVTLLDGSGGTVKWEAYPAINGGAVLNLRQPIKLTANTALCLTSTTVTTHSIFIGYYIAA